MILGLYILSFSISILIINKLIFFLNSIKEWYNWYLLFVCAWIIDYIYCYKVYILSLQMPININIKDLLT